FFGTIYGSLWRFGTPNSPILSAHAFAEAVLYLPLHMFLGYAIIYGLFPKYLTQGRYVELLVGVVLLVFLTACLSILITEYLVNFYRAWQGLSPIKNTLSAALLAGLRGSNTVAGFVVAIKLIKYWYFKKMEAEELKQANLKAELELLKGQLHPHFLFNTLNNLYGLILKQSEDASRVVLKIAALLEYMLTESRRPLIPVERELRMVKDYIALEQLRFGERLDIHMEVEGCPNEKAMAPLLLLPLVENAFKHGASQLEDQPWISLTIRLQEDAMKVKLINGKPLTPVVNGKSTGIGLANVRKRLRLLYPHQG
ncbi:MAG: histidine kinase, partial [Cyclobacteriaceae bacterium]|nr:histidine kinase [Cyclobacteriaceae bacterium]